MYIVGQVLRANCVFDNYVIVSACNVYVYCVLMFACLKCNLLQFTII